MALPPCPPQLKAIQHYLKTASEHDKRDPVVSYYCRLYALQRGMEIDKKSPGCRAFFVALMDQLEATKKGLQNEEAVHNEVVGQAHMEHYSLKVFLFADNEDRAGRFSKNVVKSFYTAGMLFDVLTTFGELSEDLQRSQKYAKWKAAYIHRCLKEGQTPIAGPVADEDGEFGPDMPQPGMGQAMGGASGAGPYQPNQFPAPNVSPPDPGNLNTAGGFHAPPTTPQEPISQPAPVPAPRAATNFPPPAETITPPANPGGVQLRSEDYQKAMKFCKYAGSALQYEDSKTAIDNLQKALRLLSTGKE